MRFLELYDKENEQDILVNMDKVLTIEPDIETEGGMFSSGQEKEVGATLFFACDADCLTVRQTKKEILELTKSL